MGPGATQAGAPMAMHTVGPQGQSNGIVSVPQKFARESPAAVQIAGVHSGWRKLLLQAEVVGPASPARRGGRRERHREADSGSLSAQPFATGENSISTASYTGVAGDRGGPGHDRRIHLSGSRRPACVARPGTAARRLESDAGSSPGPRHRLNFIRSLAGPYGRTGTLDARSSLPADSGAICRSASASAAEDIAPLAQELLAGAAHAVNRGLSRSNRGHWHDCCSTTGPATSASWPAYSKPLCWKQRTESFAPKTCRCHPNPQPMGCGVRHPAWKTRLSMRWSITTCSTCST